MTHRRPATAFILITLFLDVLGIGLIIPIFPKWVEHFAGGSTVAAAGVLGLLVALYSLMQFLCAPILGSLSDRFGRRSVLLASLLGSGLDYLVLAYAPNLAWFFVGRIIAGISGASFSTASAYIADVSPPEKRAQNFGLIGAAFGFGFIAGPALGGWLGSLGLRIPFLVAAGLTLLNWLYGLLILPESLPPSQRRPFTWARANPVGSLLALRRYPVVFGLTATFVLAHLAQHGVHSTWVLYTSHRYHWTSWETGLSLAMVGLMAVIVQGGLVRVIVPKLGERRALLVGLTSGMLTMTAYGLATAGWMIYVILAVGSLGAIGGPAVQALIARQIPLNEQGAVQGALASLGSVTGILGPLAATNLFGYFITERAPVYLPGAAFFLGSILIFAGLLLAMRTFRRETSRPGTAALTTHAAPAAPPGA